jgi:NAD(P)-dependent dehydrogenase (short-subunit alcohol dehydrogenase family)
MVSSHVQAMGQINFDDLKAEPSYSAARAYNSPSSPTSCSPTNLARRLKGTSVTANALHPGVVRTSFGAEDPGVIRRLFTPFMRFFLKSPLRRATSPVSPLWMVQPAAVEPTRSALTRHSRPAEGAPRVRLRLTTRVVPLG